MAECVEYSQCSLSVNYYFVVTVTITLWPPKPVYSSTEIACVLRSGSKSLPSAERKRQRRICFLTISNTGFVIKNKPSFYLGWALFSRNFLLNPVSPTASSTLQFPISPPPLLNSFLYHPQCQKRGFPIQMNMHVPLVQLSSARFLKKL